MLASRRQFAGNRALLLRRVPLEYVPKRSERAFSLTHGLLLQEAADELPKPKTKARSKSKPRAEASIAPESPQTTTQDSAVSQAEPNSSESVSTAPESILSFGKGNSYSIDEIRELTEEHENEFLTTIFENMEPYIDTYEVYKELTNSGFTPAQADEAINLLIVQLNSKLSKLSTKYSQEYELENERYLFESAQQELRVDITRNRELHITDNINQINSLERDFGTISDELNNHLIQMKNDIQVAINDQKSENTLMSKKIMLRIQETNHKITTELNMAMRSEIESLRWHLSRWGLIAILTSVFSACASFYVYRSKLNKIEKQRHQFVPLVVYEPSEYDEDDFHADLDPDVL